MKDMKAMARPFLALYAMALVIALLGRIGLAVAGHNESHLQAVPCAPASHASTHHHGGRPQKRAEEGGEPDGKRVLDFLEQVECGLLLCLPLGVQVGHHHMAHALDGVPLLGSQAHPQLGGSQLVHGGADEKSLVNEERESPINQPPKTLTTRNSCHEARLILSAYR